MYTPPVVATDGVRIEVSGGHRAPVLRGGASGPNLADALMLEDADRKSVV